MTQAIPTPVRDALARAREEDQAERDDLAAAAAWRRSGGRLGGPPGPPRLPAIGGAGGSESRPEVYTQGLTAVKRAPAPAPPTLDLTHRQQLSQAIEQRRWELLADARHHWQNRLDERAAELARYRAEVAETGALAAAAELGGFRGLAAELVETAAVVAAAAERAERRRRYAASRVRSLAGELGPRAAACGAGERWIRCGCEGGAARPVPDECRQRAVCASCRKIYARRMRRRVLEAVPRWVASMRRERRAPRVRMLTLTVRHSGDLRADRAELVRGWTGLRKQLHRWFGEALPFVLVWETTPGADGLGHEHAHVIVIGGPSWWNYAAIARTWRKVCPRSTNIDIQVAGSRGGSPAHVAAMYVSKYVTKGAEIGGARWSDELVAQTIAAHYNQRMISTSVRFWVPPVPVCPCCGDRYRTAPAPNGWRRAVDLRDGVLFEQRIGGERAPPGA